MKRSTYESMAADLALVLSRCVRHVPGDIEKSARSALDRYYDLCNNAVVCAVCNGKWLTDLGFSRHFVIKHSSILDIERNIDSGGWVVSSKLNINGCITTYRYLSHISSCLWCGSTQVKMAANHKMDLHTGKCPKYIAWAISRNNK